MPEVKFVRLKMCNCHKISTWQLQDSAQVSQMRCEHCVTSIWGHAILASLNHNTFTNFVTTCSVVGHRGVVNTVHWSCRDRYLITASEDKTACVWGLGLSDPILTFATASNNFGADKEGGLKPNKVEHNSVRSMCNLVSICAEPI